MLGEKRKGGSNAGEKSPQKLKRGLKNKLQRAGEIDKVPAIQVAQCPIQVA